MSKIAISTAAAVAALAVLAPMQASAQQRGNERVAPRGTFAETCSGAYTNQGRLYADCRDTRGGVRGTSIELAACSSSDIANDNGLLVCNGGRTRGTFERDGNGNGGGNGGGWGGGNGGGHGGNNGGGWGNGGGRNSITVYRDANYRGQSTSFNGTVEDLSRTSFNDIISSMRFEGAWEACSSAYFRGDCQIFYGDVRDLSRTNLNDRISSLRPVRGGGRR